MEACRWLDQRLALDWVHHNIAALGGDPDRVTIIGESAGAESVDALITAPPDPLPFDAAIMQSGQATLRADFDDPATSWKTLVGAAGCPSDEALECIRAVPASKLRETIERLALNFGPVPDGGVTWTNTPRKNRLASTDQYSLIARVPLLIGSNADEGRIYTVGLNDTEEFLRTSFPGGDQEGLIQGLLDAYPLGAPGIANEFERISTISTESAFQCPVKLVSEESAAVGIKAWRYYFNASFPNTQLFDGSGAYHSAEVREVFGTYPQKGATRFQVEVSKAMQKAWAKFAKEPKCGPGWEMVPHLGVFGGGARAGVRDKGREALMTINAEDVDQRCKLYQKLYDAASIG